MDQANMLRNMVLEKPPAAKPEYVGTARVITITSGKGGVGKSNFSVNLAIYFAQKGKRVVVLDADFGLANVEVLFGVVPKYSLADTLSGKMTIDDIITDGPGNVKFISAGSGLKTLTNITDKQLGYLVSSLSRLDQIADIILVDTGAGVSNTVKDFILASNETIIVTTPEPTSMTDAYALIKMVKEETTDLPAFKFIINRTESSSEGDSIFQKLQAVSGKFLGITLQFLGNAPYDAQLVKAVKSQQPVLLYAPNSHFAKAVTEIGDKLLKSGETAVGKEVQKEERRGIKSFFKRLVQSSQSKKED